MLRDTAAFWEWVGRNNPTIELARFVESWLSELTVASWAAPSQPVKKDLRTALLQSDGDEVVVAYQVRVDEPVDIVDLLWLGTTEELDALPNRLS